MIEPHSLIVDRILSRAQVDSEVMAARRTTLSGTPGDEALARAALAPNFNRQYIATGRPQGLTGPLAASN